MRRASLLPALVAALALSAATAATAKAPTTGTYHATGSGIAFKFSLHKGKCPLPPKNLTNPQAKRGKVGRGLCFNSADDPPVQEPCQGGGGISGETAIVSAFSRLRLSRSGALHVKAYSYASAPDPDGYTELSLKVSGSHASGFVRQTTTTSANGSPATCDTGKLSFSAHK
jgi:uncharacterized low-complexity protein